MKSWLFSSCSLYFVESFMLHPQFSSPNFLLLIVISWTSFGKKVWLRELPHGKINLLWFGEDVHFLLTKLPWFKIINSQSQYTVHCAWPFLKEALYSAAKMGIMASKRQCVLRNTLGVSEKKNILFRIITLKLFILAF